MTKLVVARNVQGEKRSELLGAISVSIMTTPVERMRALRFGCEMLEILLRDPSRPCRVSRQVLQARLVYPTTEQWIDLLNHRDEPLPAGLSHAMRSVRQLLTDALAVDGDGEELHASLRRSLRHFPSFAEIDAWCGVDSTGDIRSHLVPEEEWDRHAIPVQGPLRVDALSVRS